jgi:hypothetical protein
MPDKKVHSLPAEPADPWRSFLRDLDATLTGAVELHCLGGFVVAQHYGAGRATSDIDFLAALIESPADDLELLADLALSKVERNGDRDREDFLRLTRAGLVNLETFKTRYFEELRPYLLTKQEWHDRTVQLWLEIASIPDTRR